MFKIHLIIFANNCNFVGIGTTIEFTSIYRLDISKSDLKSDRAVYAEKIALSRK